MADSTYCATCKTDTYRVCPRCAAHFLSATPGLVCFDCAHDEASGRD